MTMIRRYIAREIVGAVLFVLAAFLGLRAPLPDVVAKPAAKPVRKPRAKRAA